MAARTKAEQRLTEVLLKSNDEERRVVYFGIGYGISLNPAFKHITRNDSSYKVKVANTTADINELTILDYDQLKHCANTMMHIRLAIANPEPSEILSAANLTDAYGITKYLSKGDVELIDSNISLFRTAASAYNAWRAERED